MKTVEEIQAAIANLQPGDFAKVRDWILEREDADIAAALVESEAQIDRGEFMTSEQIRKHFGFESANSINGTDPSTGSG